jgi:NAD-dependent SIR2 family protein deacetylase
MRPHVLWFDELYTSHVDYRWPRIMEACEDMRLVLAVGTSFSVGVTDLIRREANRRRAPLFIIDPSAPSGLAVPEAVHVREKAEELLPMAVEALISLRSP